MGRSRTTLESWIGEALVDPDKPGACTMLALVHMVGPTEREIHTKKIAPGVDVQDLANLFRGKAEAYAQDLPGAQTFNILAFYAGSNEPQARWPFLITGETQFSGLATEGPSPSGQLQQNMRHQEMVLGLAFRQTQVVFDTMMRIQAGSDAREQRYQEREERLMAENFDAHQIVREVIERQMTSDHDRHMTRMNFERTTGERKKFLTFLPALVNTVLGREIFPQSTADTALFESLADNLTPDQIEKLACILPPELQGPLAVRISAHLDKKAKAEAEAARVRALAENSGSTAAHELEMGRGS